ncbi:hypothetical protein ABIF78_007696 [Bradyrhizobium japonicum]|jgi:hypothetical protein
MKYTLRISRKGCRETIVREVFDGSELAAERRLSELWNQHAAHDGNDRFRATLADHRSRRILQTIN